MSKKDQDNKKNYEVGSIPSGQKPIWIWKAFVLFDTDKTDELKVDVSGDDFSLNPIDAIRFAYQSLGDRLTSLIGCGLTLFINDEEVECGPETKSFKENRIVLLAEKFNDSREFKNCLLGGDPEKDLSVVLALKHVPGMVENGMEVHMADYDVRTITVVSKSKQLGPDNVAVKKFRMEYNGERDEASIFPDVLKFKGHFKWKDEPLMLLNDTEFLQLNSEEDDDLDPKSEPGDESVSVTQF